MKILPNAVDDMIVERLDHGLDHAFSRLGFSQIIILRQMQGIGSCAGHNQLLRVNGFALA
jgi:hypothetical protein